MRLRGTPSGSDGVPRREAEERCGVLDLLLSVYLTQCIDQLVLESQLPRTTVNLVV